MPPFPTPVVALVLALLLATLTTGATTGTAAAAPEENRRYCGVVLQKVDPGSDGVAALLAETGNGHAQLLERTFHLGNDEVACFVAAQATRLAVGRVLPSHAPGVVYVLRVISVGAALHDGLPARLPAVGPTEPPIGRVFNTGPLGLTLRGAPDTTSAVLRRIPNNTEVTIQCQTQGVPVGRQDGSGAATTLWDLVVYDGQVGYVTDAYAFTGSDDAVAPNCA